MGDRKCEYCEHPASLRCSRCGTTYYCNASHQKQDWASHKAICRPFKQVSHPTLGRYLVASKDIKAGTLLLTERPIARGPPACSFLVCIGCYEPIVRSDFYKCSQCSWPACSESCLVSNDHELECSVLRKDESKCGVPFDTIETPRYDLILIVRCLLLKQTDAKNWQVIQSLESHSEQRSSDPYHIAAVRYLTEVCKVELDQRSVQQVRGAVITNSINTTSVFGTTVRGIYPNISMLNHSCLPNITLRSDKNHTIYVYTTVNIKKGEGLNFSYIPVTDPLWKRKEDLSNIYFFDCKCNKCQDPTEQGNNFSNPKCSTCRKGYMQRSTKSIQNWECSNCPEKMSYDDVINSSDEIFKKMLFSKSRLRSKADLMSVVDSSACHCNHYAYLALLQSLLEKGTIINPSVADLDLKIYAWKEILRILGHLEPGLTRKRGVSIVELSSLLIAPLKKVAGRDANNSNTNDAKLKQNEAEEISPTTSQIPYTGKEMAYIEEARSYIKEALVILNLEPAESTELKWLQLAKIIQGGIN